MNASPQALARLSVALELTRAERAYLFELAGRRDPESSVSENVADAPASIVALVQTLHCPAYGLDGAWDACCWNAAAERLFGDWLGNGQQKNLLRYVFCEPSARVLIQHWEDRSRRLLAEFRADYGRRLGDPRTQGIVDQLRRESAAFADAWEAQSVTGRQGGQRSFHHSQDGIQHFEQHTFSPAERPDYKLVVLVDPAMPGSGNVLHEMLDGA